MSTATKIYQVALGDGTHGDTTIAANTDSLGAGVDLDVRIAQDQLTKQQALSALNAVIQSVEKASWPA